MSSNGWSRTAWALSLALCCAGGSAVAQSADSLAVQHVSEADAYLVPRALVADYVVCAAEAEALRAVETEAARVIAAQDSLVLVLAERSEATQREASACSRVLGLSEGRVRALGAEAEHWRAAARSAERRARWWRIAATAAGSAAVALFAVWQLGP
ncbi:MAG: hypothetical protein ACK41D_07200 [Rubricoccaceae bacterium]